MSATACGKPSSRRRKRKASVSLESCYLLVLMTRAESVEEVDERHAAFDGGKVRDGVVEFRAGTGDDVDAAGEGSQFHLFYLFRRNGLLKHASGG